MTPSEIAPQALREKAARMDEENAEMNPWSCLIVLALVVPLTAVTAEFVCLLRQLIQLFPQSLMYSVSILSQLVESLERIRETSGIKQEWFGLILLPIVSYSAEAIVTVLYFIKRALFMAAERDELARGRTIDLSIQFALFWMPFLVLLAWGGNKPLFLLFGGCGFLP